MLPVLNGRRPYTGAPRFLAGQLPVVEVEGDTGSPSSFGRTVMAHQKVSARRYVEARAAEQAAKNKTVNAKRQATRRRRGVRRLPMLVGPIKAATFYVSPKISRDWFANDRQWWHACYFVNTVHWKQLTWRANQDGFVQLLYRYLERVVQDRSDLATIKDTLTTHRVIETDGIAHQGKALGYRLVPDFAETRRFVCADEQLNERLWQLHAEEHGSHLPVHRWLKAHFGSLHFDLEKAFSIIDRMTPDRQSDLTPAQYRTQLREQCQRFADHEYWFVVDDYGRVHTPVTSLPRELRCCLRVEVNGVMSPLVEIDLKNSQPLLLCLLARHWLASSKMAQSRMRNREFDAKRGKKWNPYHAAKQTTHNNQQTHKRINSVNRNTTACADNDLQLSRPVTELHDIEESLAICEAGQFYESMMPEDQRADRKARDRFKELFYGVLFGPNKSKSCFPNRTRLRFQQRHGALADVLFQFKTKNYRHAAHLLQNTESSLFIGTICDRIRKERSDIVVFTIHDSILTLPGHVQYLHSVIEDEFGKLGIRPTLTQKEHDQ
jgi:hypothetical protein